MRYTQYRWWEKERLNGKGKCEKVNFQVNTLSDWKQIIAAENAHYFAEISFACGSLLQSVKSRNTQIMTRPEYYWYFEYCRVYHSVLVCREWILTSEKKEFVYFPFFSFLVRFFFHRSTLSLVARFCLYIYTLQSGNHIHWNRRKSESQVSMVSQWRVY